MKRFALILLAALTVFFTQNIQIVEAQTCGGTTVRVGMNYYFNCQTSTGKACNNGEKGCTCSQSCTPLLTELCSDYHNNCTACADTNLIKAAPYECWAGSCSWNGQPNASCSMCYTGWQNVSCGGGSCSSTQMLQKNVASGTTGICATQWRCSTIAACAPTPTDPKPTPTPAYDPVGFHDASDCSSTAGWTCDADDYNTALTVHLYEGSTFLGSTVANIAREAAVGASCGGNANHGFSFTTPESLKDGTPHSITAYAINIGSGTGNPALGSSPRSITCAAPTSTPTPTSAPVTPFVKVKNTSFYKYGNLDVVYPATLTAYDADDDGSSVFNQGTGVGVVLSQGTTATTNATVSTSGWNRQNVSAGSFSASSYITYVKAKKTVTSIASLNSVTTANTIYLYTGNLTLDQSSFPASTIPSGTVLLVEGNATVGSVAQPRLNNVANTPFALIVSGTLTFADATTQVNGLYSANTVNFGSGSTPLKVVGNISSSTSSSVNRQRVSAPLNAPSLFVVFDATHYVNLVDKISVVKSDYQQVQ